MSVAYNPRKVTDGLRLHLDAGSPKSYGKQGPGWRDLSGNNNNGTITGAIPTQGPVPGTGYVIFDSTNDVLSTGASSDFVFGTGDFTWEAWFNRTSTIDYARVVNTGAAWGTTSSAGMGVYGNTGTAPNKVFFYVYNISTAVLIAGSTTIENNRWYHLAVTRREGIFYLWLNGQLEGSYSLSPTTSTETASSNTVSLGGNGATTEAFVGYISNARIVKGNALYTSNFRPPTEPLTNISNTVLLTCQGSSIVDASSNAYAITNNGATAVFDTYRAFDFDGIDDYVNFDSSITLNTNTGFTLLFAVKGDPTQSNSQWNMIYSHTNNGGYFQLGTYNTTNVGLQLNTLIPTSNVHASNVTNGWNLIACGYQPTTRYPFMYPYNSDVGIQYVTQSSAAPSMNITLNHFVKTDNYAPSGVEYYGGKFSSLMVYDRVLTEDEVKQNFYAIGPRYGISYSEIVTSGLVLNLDALKITSLDPNANTTWTDISGNGNNASLSNTTYYNNGWIDFNTSFGTISSFSDDSDTAFSVFCWINPDTMSDQLNADGNYYNWIINKRPTVSPNSNSWQMLTRNSKISVQMWNSSGTTIAPDQTSASTLNVSQWQYVGFTTPGTNGSTLKHYIDGLQDFVGTLSGDRGIATKNITIGKTGWDNIHYWNGKISNVQIYNRELTSAEVQQNFNAQRGRYGI